ncbi:MAG: protein phosphatase [Planctomycetes bacterium]|nr:protein phosphatase [Planctomycetota bacterium]
MREIEPGRLWIGNSGDLQDPARWLPLNVEAVVELADSEPAAHLPRHLIHCRFPLADGGENPDWLIRIAAQTVADLIRDRIPTLVACAWGMSRSLVTVATGLALVRRSSIRQELLSLTATGPADVSPALVAQFQAVCERA